MASASAEDKSYTEGQVTELSFIKITPEKFDDYMKYLSTTYNTIMERKPWGG